MKKFLSLATALALLGFLTNMAWAQRPQGRGPGAGGPGVLMLLNQKSVQEELKLSEDQIKQAAEIMEKQRGEFGGLRDLSTEERHKKMAEVVKTQHEALASILKEDQLKRFKQISWQLQPGMAFHDPEVVQALSLTKDQKTQVRSIQDETQKETRALFQGGGEGDRAANRGKMESLHKSASEKLLAVLTTEQQAKWKDLIGEPFKGEIERPLQRAGRGAGRGGKPRRPA